MKTGFLVPLVGAAMLSAACAADVVSDSTVVFLRPETCSFWHTATNRTMTVPVDFPEGALSATLTVTGIGYSKEYTGIIDPSFTLELPAADSPETENVYTLTLAFNDANATVRTARLGLIAGILPGADGATRCIAPTASRPWYKVVGRAVFPVPYGTTSLTVDGIEVDTGLDGAQGWYAVGGLTDGVCAELALSVGNAQYAASLVGRSKGLVLFYR